MWAQNSMARNVDSFPLHFIPRCCCCCRFRLFLGRPFVCFNQREHACAPGYQMVESLAHNHISNMQPTHMVLSISVGSENEKRHICVVIIKIMNHLQCDFFHREHCCCCQCRHRRHPRAPPPSFNLHCICLLSHFCSLCQVPSRCFHLRITVLLVSFHRRLFSLYFSLSVPFTILPIHFINAYRMAST